MKKFMFYFFLIMMFVGILWLFFASASFQYENWNVPITSSQRFHALWKPSCLTIVSALGITWLGKP